MLMNKMADIREVRVEILGHDKFSTTVADSESGEASIKWWLFNTTTNRLRG